MTHAAVLKKVKTSLSEVEDCWKPYNHVRDALETVRRTIPTALHGWEGRKKFFNQMSSNLYWVRESAPNRDVALRAEELLSKVDREEYFLNVILNDLAIPRHETDASIRFVVDNEQGKSALMQDSLVDMAINDPDFEVRRFAWLHICRQHARNPPLFNPDGGDSHGKFRGENLRRIRKEFLRSRRLLGPRGTILEPAEEVSSKGPDMVRELLAALADPQDVERKEVALTLGEIGGDEVAILLADALRSEIEEGSPDEDYQVYLASALSNLGGPVAVEGLLRAAEEGSKRVRLAALSGLESLATAGAVALTEYPEPATIESEEMKRDYLKLAERLSALYSDPETPSYVRHKAGELLDTLWLSLTTA